MAKRSWPKWANIKRILDLAKFRNKGYNDKVVRKVVTIKPILINWRQINQVVIDPHYRDKHLDHMSDELIVQLVSLLDGKFQFYGTTNGRFSYFENLLWLNEKKYRLIWLMEIDEDYVGVINAYRDDREV